MWVLIGLRRENSGCFFQSKIHLRVVQGPILVFCFHRSLKNLLVLRSENWLICLEGWFLFSIIFQSEKSASPDLPKSCKWANLSGSTLDLFCQSTCCMSDSFCGTFQQSTGYSCTTFPLFGGKWKGFCGTFPNS